jgi:hypothetical protein
MDRTEMKRMYGRLLQPSEMLEDGDLIWSDMDIVEKVSKGLWAGDMVEQHAGNGPYTFTRLSKNEKYLLEVKGVVL